jgi:glycine cleavage system H protein
MMVEIPKDLRYSKTHEWARNEKGNVRVGLSDFAQGELSDIVFVELPKPATELTQGKEMGVIESVKSASDLYAPVSGTVLEINDKLIKNPEMVNKSPYGDGWLVVIKPKAVDELRNLMDHGAYEKHIKETKH